MKSKLSALIAASLVGSTLVAGSLLSTPAHATELTKGSLELVADIWENDGSQPQDLITIGDSLFFTAETGSAGREVYRYDGTELRRFDTLPGTDQQYIYRVFEYRSGFAFLLEESETANAVGWLDGDNFEWIPRADLDFESNDYYQAVVGDVIYLLNAARTGLYSVEFGQPNHNEQAYNYELDIGTDTNTTIDLVYELQSLGHWLIAGISYDGTSGLFKLDTTATNPIWEKIGTKVATNFAPDADALFVGFNDDSIEKFELVSGEIVNTNIVTGQTAITLTDLYSLHTDNGHLFATDDNHIFWLSASGWIPIEHNGSRIDATYSTFENDFAVVSGIAYFSAQDQLFGYELGTDYSWLVLDSMSQLGASYPQYITRFGNKIAFQAESTKQDELYLLDTRDDSFEMLDINTDPEESEPGSLLTFDDDLFFYTLSPDSAVECHLMRLTDNSVEPVVDEDGNPLVLLGGDGCAEDNSSLKPNNFSVAVGENAYFLANDTSDLDPLTERFVYRQVLWRLTAGQTVPELIEPDIQVWADPGQLRVANGKVVISVYSDEGGLLHIYDPATETLTSITPNSVFFNQTPPDSVSPTFGGDSYILSSYATFGGNNANNAEKLFLLTDAGGVDRADIYAFVDASGSSNVLELDDQLGMKIQKIVPGTDDSHYYAWVKNLPFASDDEDGIVVLTRDSSERLIMTVIATLPQYDVIHNIHRVQNADHDALLLSLSSFVDNTRWTAYIDVELVIPDHVILEKANTTNLQLTYGGNDPIELKSSPYSWYFNELGILISQVFLSGGDDEEYGFAIHHFGETITSNVLADISLDGDDHFIRILENSGAVLDGEIYLTARDSGSLRDQYELYRIDPFDTVTGVRSDTPAITSFDTKQVLKTTIYPRPSGATNSILLNPNYGSEAAVVVQRSNSATNIDTTGITRTGYDLTGWSLTSDGAKAYDADESYPFTSTRQLFALWQAASEEEPEEEVETPSPPASSSGSSSRSVSISFKIETGTEGTTPTTIRATSGQAVILPKITRPGFRFLGWSESKDGLLVGEVYRPASSIALHAKFEPLQVKIFFSLPAGAEGPKTMVYGDLASLSLPEVTLKDHQLIGWIDAETGARISSDWQPTESTMLIPQFVKAQADATIYFWNNSKLVSTTQLRKLAALKTSTNLVSGARTIYITGNDSSNIALAKARAMAVAIKLRKLGVTDRIILNSTIGERANKAEVAIY